MKTINIDEDQVTTLEEVAKTLSEDYGWTKYVVEPNHIEFWAKDSKGKEVHGTVDSSGFAYDFDDPDEPLRVRGRLDRVLRRVERHRLGVRRGRPHGHAPQLKEVDAMEMKSWKVSCRAADGTEYEVGVMCSGEAAAKRCAERSLMEGRHITAKAVTVEKTDGI